MPRRVWQRGLVALAGLSVAMSNALSLTTTFSLRYSNDPGNGLKSTDTVLVTGVSYKYD